MNASTSGQWKPAPGSTALYRLFDSTNQLLYVGISVRPEVRWEEHALSRPWWHLVARKEVEWLTSRSAATDVEDEAIRVERPLFNSVRASDGAVVRVVYDDSPARDKIRRTVAREIEAGILPSGARVTATGLARRFGVSAATAASALNQLPAGYLEARSNKTFVADRSAPVPVEAPAPWCEKMPHDLHWRMLA